MILRLLHIDIDDYLLFYGASIIILCGLLYSFFF
jgi:hypothetical protein